MEGCGNCLKWLMFIFNFLFFVCGAALLGVGIWVRVDGTSFMSLVGDNPVIFNAVYILIAVGAALMVISFLGCCGAMKENKCLLGTFFGIVLIIFIAEIVGGILAFVYLPEATATIYGSIARFDSTGNDTDTTTKLITEAWNTIQAVFPCCGFNDSQNWRQLNEGFRSGVLVPESCCVRDTFSLQGTIRNRTNCVALVSDFYEFGCEQSVNNYFWVVGGVGLGILAVELLAMIFACCLYRSVDKDY